MGCGGSKEAKVNPETEDEKISKLPIEEQLVAKGWTLYKRKTLLGYPPSLGEHSFETLEEAFKKAKETEGCGGIVETRSGKYEIRQTREPIKTSSSSTERCWIRPMALLTLKEVFEKLCYTFRSNNMRLTKHLGSFICNI